MIFKFEHPDKKSWKKCGECKKLRHSSFFGKEGNPCFLCQTRESRSKEQVEGQRIRRSILYKNWRRAVLERDNYTCQGCGIKRGRLSVDHIKPFVLFPALRLDINNGQTLCLVCHSIKTSQDLILMRKEHFQLWG